MKKIDISTRLKVALCLMVGVLVVFALHFVLPAIWNEIQMWWEVHQAANEAAKEAREAVKAANESTTVFNPVQLWQNTLKVWQNTLKGLYHEEREMCFSVSWTLFGFILYGLINNLFLDYDSVK